jgi:polyhydroxyalkanoate synthesis regulator phasin
MVDKDIEEEKAPAAVPPAAPRRGPGHRGADMRDTVAEMAERAQLISQEAGSKVSAAMKDVISAAAGLAGFAIESARDLVQYMVRRGQMTQEEADKLIREAEDAHAKKPASEKVRPTASKIAADKAAVDKAARDAANAAAMLNAPPQRPGAFSLRTGGPRPVVKPADAPPAPTPAPAPAPAAPAKAAAPAIAKPVAKAPAKPAPKTVAKPAAKAPAKPAAKAPSKGSASKPTAKAGKSAKAGSKVAAKPAKKSAKPPAKKKR